MNDPVNKNKNVGSLEIGTFVGGTYRILDFVGQGGMGFVYKVEHLMMAKVMALKVLRSEQVSDSVWKRFRTEAQAIARLDHPNVVRIYDMSQTADGLPFYTMDLLIGQSLADYCDAYDQLSIQNALPIFRQVCAGLAYAHDRGIIHRDIKPGNIMLIEKSTSVNPAQMFSLGEDVSNAQVKIVDFGIAKLNFDGNEGQGLTRPGEVFGSPLYMSPEQCSGQPLDYRTDMYSVGVTMFQALTGRPPLVGRTAIETTMMHQTVDPPRLRDKDPDTEYPEALEKIVARLLAKSPEKRYDSLADVAAQLLAMERGEVVPGLASGVSANSVATSGQYGARKKFDAVLDTSNFDTTGGVTDDGTSTRANGRNRTMILGLLFACVLLLGGVGLVIWQMQKHAADEAFQKAYIERRELDRRSNIIATDVLKAATSKNDPGEDALSPREESDIKTFLATQKGPYVVKSRLIKGMFGPERIDTFVFPKTFSIGSIDHTYNRQSRYAQGTLDIPANGRMKFDCGAATRRYPELLKYFRPNDIRWLVIMNMSYRNENLARSFAHLTGLNRLEFRQVEMTDADLPYFDKLTGCRSLVLNRTNITGTGLARSQIVRRLHTFCGEHLADAGPLLPVLAQTPKVELVLNYVKLTSADFDQIAKMRDLRLLMLKSAAITDADLLKLTVLKDLEEIDLEGCERLGENALQIVKKFKKLKVVTMPFAYLNEKNEAELRKALPHLTLFK